MTDKEINDLFLNNPELGVVDGTDEAVARLIENQKSGKYSIQDNAIFMNSYVCIVVANTSDPIAERMIDRMRTTNDGSMVIDAYSSPLLIDQAEENLADRVYWIKIQDLGMLCNKMDGEANTEVKMHLTTKFLEMEMKVYEKQLGV